MEGMGLDEAFKDSNEIDIEKNAMLQDIFFTQNLRKSQFFFYACVRKKDLNNRQLSAGLTCLEVWHIKILTDTPA
jgi:hypothetical protein